MMSVSGFYTHVYAWASSLKNICAHPFTHTHKVKVKIKKLKQTRLRESGKGKRHLVLTTPRRKIREIQTLSKLFLAC